MKIINLTPHDVNICDEFGYIIKSYRASGKVARCCNEWTDVDNVDGIPVVTRRVREIIDLPESQEDTYYIVSNIILDYCTDRTDLLAPVKQVKINGRIVGCRAFVNGR